MDVPDVISELASEKTLERLRNERVKLTESPGKR